MFCPPVQAASYRLGLLLAAGVGNGGVAQPHAALRCFVDAARSGHLAAQYEAGSMLLHAERTARLVSESSHTSENPRK